MKDLTFLKDGNDTKVDGLINFEKFRMIAKEVRHLCNMCSAKYVSELSLGYCLQLHGFDTLKKIRMHFRKIFFSVVTRKCLVVKWEKPFFFEKSHFINIPLPRMSIQCSLAHKVCMKVLGSWEWQP